MKSTLGLLSRGNSSGVAIIFVVLISLINIADSKAIGSETTSTISPSPESKEREVSVPTSTVSSIKVSENEVKNETDVQVDKNVTANSPSAGHDKSNYTNTNYIIEYKPQVFDSPEDIKTQQEWGGNCTLAHWDKCKALQTWFGNYNYIDPKDGKPKNYLIDCKLEPVVCLTNSWTVTRCNLLCMSQCNREIQFKYDKYVSHNGECKAHAHGKR